METRSRSRSGGRSSRSRSPIIKGAPKKPSGKAKSGAASEKKTKNEGSANTVKAGLTFPVGRIHTNLKKAKYADRTSMSAAVSLAAAVEYIVAEILEAAGNMAKEQKKIRITDRIIANAIRNDEEMQKLFAGSTFARSGVSPHIESVLLGKGGPAEGEEKPAKKRKVPIVGLTAEKPSAKSSKKTSKKNSKKGSKKGPKKARSTPKKRAAKSKVAKADETAAEE